MCHQALHIQWCGDALLPKQDKYNCSMAHGSPNTTYTIGWGRMAHQTIQLQWFECPRLTKRDVYNSLGTHGSPNPTNTIVWLPMAHQALHIQRWGALFAAKLCKSLINNTSPLSSRDTAMVIWAIGCGYEPHRGYVKPDMFDACILLITTKKQADCRAMVLWAAGRGFQPDEGNVKPESSCR